jgi:hypothetical protein
MGQQTVHVVNSGDELVSAVQQFGSTGEDTSIVLTTSFSLASTSFQKSLNGASTGAGGRPPYSSGTLYVSSGPNGSLVLDTGMRANLTPPLGVGALVRLSNFTMVNLCDQVIKLTFNQADAGEAVTSMLLGLFQSGLQRPTVVSQVLGMRGEGEYQEGSGAPLRQPIATPTDSR